MRGHESSVELQKDPSAYGRLEIRVKPKSVRAFRFTGSPLSGSEPLCSEDEGANGNSEDEADEDAPPPVRSHRHHRDIKDTQDSTEVCVDARPNGDADSESDPVIMSDKRYAREMMPTTSTEVKKKKKKDEDICPTKKAPKGSDHPPTREVAAWSQPQHLQSPPPPPQVREHWLEAITAARKAVPQSNDLWQAPELTIAREAAHEVLLRYAPTKIMRNLLGIAGHVAAIANALGDLDISNNQMENPEFLTPPNSTPIPLTLWHPVVQACYKVIQHEQRPWDINTYHRARSGAVHLLRENYPSRAIMSDADVLRLSSAAAAVATRLTSIPSATQRARANIPRALPLSQEFLTMDQERPIQSYALNVTVVQHEQNRILSQGNLQKRYRWTFHYCGEDPSKSYVGPPGHQFPVVFNDTEVLHIAVVCIK